MAIGDGEKNDVFVLQAARICHEALRTYCDVIGDPVLLPWELAPAWQRESSEAGVRSVLRGSITKPSDAHQQWMVHKVADGWKYGPTKDSVTKTHPCIVPFDQLPDRQKRKDHIFFGIVQALIADLSKETI